MSSENKVFAVVIALLIAALVFECVRVARGMTALPSASQAP